MSIFERHINDVSKTVQLSTAEKERMRDKINAYMEHTPVRPKTARRMRGAYLHMLLEYRLVATLAVLMLVVVGSGSATFAARDALPGDTLYGVKIAAEDIQGEFLFNDEARAQWALERVHRRITEASALATREAFTGEREVIALNTIAEAGDYFQQRVAAIETAAPAKAAALRIAFAARTRDAATPTVAYAADTLDAPAAPEAATMAMMAPAAGDGHGTGVGGSVVAKEESAGEGEVQTMALMSAPRDDTDTDAADMREGGEPEMMALRAPETLPTQQATSMAVESYGSDPETEAVVQELLKLFEEERARMYADVAAASTVSAETQARIDSLEGRFAAVQQARAQGNILWAQGQLEAALHEVFVVRTLLVQ